jgi:5-oxoprolinase (ATP-hydrolysing)
VVLRAFEACAASQGDTNNLTFGIDKASAKENGVGTYGYYETIAGGAGAGKDWDGASGVHTHMTNTRITDPEILERRYPVILRQFRLRPHSGGRGLYHGGDGCVREIEFRIPTQVSILSERRVLTPYGLEGGENGRIGINLWERQNGDNTYTTINLGGKNTVSMRAGDRITIQTPGGGGWGLPDEAKGSDGGGERKTKKRKLPTSAAHANDKWHARGSVSERSGQAESAS